MSKRLNPGQRIRDYEVVRLLNVGGFAVSYEARHPSGEKIFLKQYKSPSPTTPWYRDYVAYQAEIKRRIESSAASRFCYRFVDFFECSVGSNCYFQAFEYVDHSNDLQRILEEARSSRDSVSWAQRLVFAKVMMAGVTALHSATVAHCDLKPENIQLISDDLIAAKYVLKIIDMDFAVLRDRRPPWDNPESGQAYVGTPNYLSPEHLRCSLVNPRAPRPSAASDVFTCGLILYQLLAGAHPYASDDDESYAKAVLAYLAAKPSLLGKLASERAQAHLQETLYQCLSPDPGARPAAADVLKALQEDLPRPPEPRPHPPTCLSLVARDGNPLRITIRTVVGRSLLKRFGPEADYCEGDQFTLDRSHDGQWYVTPTPGTRNETLLNGRRIRAETVVKDGDILAVGNEGKKVIKIPLKIQLSDV